MKFITSLLLCLFIVILYSQEKTYVLVNNPSDLIAGEKYIIVNSQNDVAVGYQNTINRPQASVTVVDHSITLTPATSQGNNSNVYEFTLGNSEHTIGNWTIYDNVYEGYLYAASSSGNFLRKRNTNIDGNSEWKITFNGLNAEIAAQGNNDHNKINYNSSAQLFSCYLSGQKPIQFYKEVSANSYKYYRSKESGNWTSLSTWEISPNGISNWVNSTSYPDDSTESVKIQSGHEVILNNALIVIRNTEVEGVLESRSFNFGVRGSDANYGLRINSNGIFRVNGDGHKNAGDKLGLIESGGILELKSFNGGNEFMSNYISASDSSLFTFDNNAIFNYNYTGSKTLGSANFPNIFRTNSNTDLVIFRLNQNFPQNSNFGSGTTNKFNAILEVVNSKTIKFSGNGDKIFKGGIISEGTFKVSYDSGNGKFILGDSQTIPTLGSNGTLHIEIPHNKLQFENGGIIPTQAEVILTSLDETPGFTRNSGELKIDGILDIGLFRITNSQPGKVQIKGTLKTKHLGGLTNTGSAIPSGIVELLDGSKIDYNGADQKITNLNYYHLKLSGSGIKTPQSATSIHTDGSVIITGNPTVDFSTFNLGSINTNNTKFIMDGGRLILGTTGTQPNMRGTYNLTGGVIEFVNSDAITQTIRNGPNYFYKNIEISGTNVGNSSGNLNLNSGGTFVVNPNGIFEINLRSIKCAVADMCEVRVKTNGIFKTGNSLGFHGFDNGGGIGNDDSAIHSNITNIILEEGSIIDYRNPTILQEISNFEPGYKNLTISGKTWLKNQIKVNNLTIVENSGELTIIETPENQNFSNALISKKGIQVIGDGILKVENNSVLMQDADAINSGNILLDRKFVFSNDRKQYNFVTSPLIGQSIKTIYPEAPSVIYHKESTNFFYNAVQGTYVAGKGFGIKEPPISINAFTTSVFQGIPFVGDLNYPLSYTTTAPPDVETGFNFVGNPYPSHLDIQELYTGNSDKIEKDFYFWDNRGNTNYVQQGSAYSGAHYAIYNVVNGTGNGAGVSADSLAGATPRIPNRFVRPGTAFMVKALSSANGLNLAFKNDYRSLSNSSPEFFGKNSENVKVDRYWLTLRTPQGIEYMTAVVYFENGSNSFGIDDSESNQSSDDIYSWVDQNQLAIHGKPPFIQTDKVQLGVRLFEPGMYVISLFDKEGIFQQNQSIYLRVIYQNEIYNLSQVDHKFLSSEGEFNKRFEIIYKMDLNETNPEILENNEILMKLIDKNIVVNSSILKINHVSFYDLNSKLLYEKNEINSKTLKIPTDFISSKIIFVNVQLENGKIISKKFILH